MLLVKILHAYEIFF